LDSQEIQLSLRLSAARKPIGLRLVVPTALTVIPGPPGSSFHAVEKRGTRIVGTFDLGVITPGLIMDRDGVLREAAVRTAEAIVAPPRDGYLVNMGDVLLPAGSAWRIDALMQRGPDGRAPALPYQSVVAMGHPDLSLPIALMITINSVTDPWPPSIELLDSLTFLGAPAAAAREVQVLPITY
jgi:hypothetical protein